MSCGNIPANISKALYVYPCVCVCLCIWGWSPKTFVCWQKQSKSVNRLWGDSSHTFLEKEMNVKNQETRKLISPHQVENVSTDTYTHVLEERSKNTHTHTYSMYAELCTFPGKVSGIQLCCFLPWSAHNLDHNQEAWRGKITFNWLYVYDSVDNILYSVSIKVKPMHKEPLKIPSLTIFGKKSESSPFSEMLSSKSSTTICLGTVSASKNKDNKSVKELYNIVWY